MPSKKNSLKAKFKYIWKVSACSLGGKANPKHDKFSDHVALARSLIVLVYVVTNMVIVAGNIRHW